MTYSFQMGAFKASVQLLRFFFPIMVLMESSVQMEISLAALGTAGNNGPVLTCVTGVLWTVQ